nr:MULTISPECIES: hypothetical protein [unclassified Frankia]
MRRCGGTNDRSNGIEPWLQTLDVSVAAYVYLEPWHPDIEELVD